MSFIDMLANHVWSEQDILAHTEAMVRSVVPLADEILLNRKVQGAQAGLYTLTEADQAQIALLAQASLAAQQAGAAARLEMALLRRILDYEAAERALAQGPAPEAQAVIDAAPPEVTQWVERRRQPR